MNNPSSLPFDWYDIKNNYHKGDTITVGKYTGKIIRKSSNCIIVRYPVGIVKHYRPGAVPESLIPYLLEEFKTSSLSAIAQRYGFHKRSLSYALGKRKQKRKYHKWKDKDDMYLIANQYQSVNELAIHFRVSDKAIENRLRYLGLKKKRNKIWKEGEKALFRELYVRGYSTHLIARILGVTISQVYNLSNRLKKEPGWDCARNSPIIRDILNPEELRKIIERVERIRGEDMDCNNFKFSVGGRK